MKEQTQILSVHPRRKTARKRERLVQSALVKREHYHRMTTEEAEAIKDAPGWARGARVERAGLLQHAVVLTENVGR